MPIELKPGDELVLYRRRTTTTKDPTTGELVSNSNDLEISKVQLQSEESRIVVGGSVEDHWVDDKRFIEIRLETRR